jgi:hypothetical protein
MKAYTGAAYVITGWTYDLYNNNLVFEARDDLSRGVIAVKDLNVLLLGPRLPPGNGILEHSQLNFCGP